MDIDFFSLLAEADRMRDRAYAPYSRFQVGAALLCADGTVVPGCNVENASFGATVCAERVAVQSAVAEGQRVFLAIAISSSGESPISPCGMCRQVLFEFTGGELPVASRRRDGSLHIRRLGELLPEGFGPASLGDR